MKKSLGALIAALALMIAAFSAYAFSPIWNVNGWSRDQLSKTGIAVSPWRHEFIGEDPPLQWVQVTFDCAAIPKDQPVVMTAWFRSADGTELGASRAERLNAIDGKIILTICIVPEQMEHSSVDILILEKTKDGSQLRGYELSMKRIAELAREQPAASPVREIQ